MNNLESSRANKQKKDQEAAEQEKALKELEARGERARKLREEEKAREVMYNNKRLENDSKLPDGLMAVDKSVNEGNYHEALLNLNEMLTLLYTDLLSDDLNPEISLFELLKTKVSAVTTMAAISMEAQPANNSEEAMVVDTSSANSAVTQTTNSFRAAKFFA